jgi:hypothetical protein
MLVEEQLLILIINFLFQSNFRDSSSERLGPVGRQDVVVGQDVRPADVAVHVSAPAVQENPARRHQEDRKEKFPL